MKKNFSLFEELDINLKTLDDIDNCLKITLGPTGKNGISYTSKLKTTGAKVSIAEELKIITSGSLLMKSLDFPTRGGNVILKLLEQASLKSHKISGDGSTTTILLACQLLKSSLKFLVNGYNSVFISNGLQKIAYFLSEKVLEFSLPVSNTNQLIGVLKTSLGKTLNRELIDLLYKAISNIGKDGLILVEENISETNAIDIVQGIELDKGFASSYFINDQKNFEVVYENPYLLITKEPINSINQLREIIEYIKVNNRPLVIVAEEINKDIISTLVLNNIQKKFKVAVVKYTSIQFIKNGILEDLSVLTHSNYFQSNYKTSVGNLTVNDLGQAQKVIIKKDKTTFIVSKFSKIIAKRRINELNRQLLLSETDYERSLFKTRIARLSGNITKIKVGLSNQYQIEEERQKIENAVTNVRASLEEGILPGGGMFYLYLKEELESWSYLNLIGEEIFSAQIVSDALIRPFYELFNNTNISRYQISQNLATLGYPYGYDVVSQKIVNTLEEGLVDSAKSVRAILWNSITIICTLILSE
jgi:chaperonin GroEL